MRNRFTSLVLLGAAWGLGSGVHAAEQPASYAANGKCFCNLPIPTSLSGEIISTPIGGQSLAQVCERVGTGPELKKTSKAYNFSVYDDMQCGHGPGLTGFNALLRDAGINEEKLGPKWDIEAAYADDASLANNSSNEGVNSSNDDGGDLGGVSRFKSQYIQVPASSKVATENTRADDSAVKQYRSANSTVAATTQDAGSMQSAEERSRIEKLPLATVVPLDGEGVSDAADASIAEVSVNSTVEDNTSVAQADSALVSGEVETVAQVIAQPTARVDSAASTAVRVPKAISSHSRKFEYVSVAPTGYDFGGAGVQWTASSLRSNSYGVLVRAGLAEDYQEVLIGATYLLPLTHSDRVSIGFSGGLEHGRFNLQAGSITTNSSSTGAFVRAQSMFEVSRRFELHGGVGYSSFFEGDPHVFGAALFHMTQKLDFIGEFEVGDNDSAGLGIRYYYR